MSPDPRRATRQRGRWLARLAYVAILLIATLSYFGFDPDAAELVSRATRGVEPNVSFQTAVDAVRNVVLFAGWGAVWAITAARGRTARTVLSATVTGAVLSLTVEGLQLFSRLRTTSLLDVLTNTGGAALGALTIVLGTAVLSRGRGRRSFVGIPAFVFAGAYLLATTAEAALPVLRGALLPEARGGPLARLEVALRHSDPGSLLSPPLFDLLLFAPLGFFLVAAWVEGGKSYRRAAVLAAGVGVIVGVGAELAHAPLGQPIDLGAAMIHAVGVALGAFAGLHWLPPISRELRRAARPAALLLCYGVLVCLWYWRPFLPETTLSGLLDELSLRRWAPLAAHAVRLDLFSVTDVAIGFFLYVPIGGLLAVWPVRRRGWLRGVLPAIYLALLAEAGQILVEARFFDGTDFLIAVAGALIGWQMIRRSGYRPYGTLAPEG